MAKLVDLLAAGAIDSNGDQLSNGVAYIYKVGTTRLASIYEDRDLTDPASNPVTLDAAGRAEVYTNEEIRLVLEDSDGNQIDDIASLGDVTQSTTSTATVLTSADERFAISHRPGFENDGSDNTQVTVPASSTSPAVVIIGSSLYKNVTDTSADLDTSGRNGLDEGTKAANTPYYLYAIAAVNGENFDLLISDNPPTTGPTGYTSYSYLGSFCTIAGAATIAEFTSENGFMLFSDEVETETHTGDTNWTSTTFASMPTTIKKAYLRLFLDPAGSDGANDTVAVSPISGGSDILVKRGTTNDRDVYDYGWCPVLTAQTLYLRTSDADNTCDVRVFGWQENPLEWA